MSIVSNLIRKTIKRTGPLNILTFFYDGRFDIDLLATGHNFFGTLENSAYPWPGYQKAEFSNLHILPNLQGINNIEFDLVMFNHRAAHNQFYSICRHIHAPGLIVDHDFNNQNPFFRLKNKQHTPFKSISCSDIVQKQYDADTNIEYGIIPKHWEFNKDIDILCSVGMHDDINICHAIKQAFPTAVFIGHHPNIPYIGTVETYEDYQNLFKRAKLFVNFSQKFNINHDILFALNNQTPIVAYNHPIYSGLLNNMNSVLVLNIEDIIPAIKNLMFDKTAYNKLSKFHTKLTKFRQPMFVTKWCKAFEEYRYKPHIE